MNQILIKSDPAYHPPKIVIMDGLETLIDMPLDEFVGWLRVARRVMNASEANNEGDRPAEDGLKSDSSVGTGG